MRFFRLLTSMLSRMWFSIPHFFATSEASIFPKQYTLSLGVAIAKQVRMGISFDAVVVTTMSKDCILFYSLESFLPQVMKKKL